MKFLISLSAVVFLSLQVQALAPACTISSSVSSGTNNVVIAFSPSPVEVVQMAGLSDSKSAPALLNLLNSYLNPAFALGSQISAQIGTLVKSAFPFLPVPIPNCRFKWITSQLYCDNVPSIILKPLCGLFGAINNISSPVTFPIPQSQYIPLNCTLEPRWGLTNIRAQEAWATGARGAGIVVANLDTGVRSTHQELVGNMRPTYNFYNAFNPKNSTPVDDVGHGTHTMGNICGKTVGVAPDATWIACKGCDNSGCGNEQLADCAQWLFCPDRNASNCDTKPRVINNSWGGGIGNTFYQSALALMKQVGIINLFSSGNSGPSCFSVMSPADGNGTKWGIISVGATACNEAIGAFSSVGPSQAADYMGGLGIHIVAPGTTIFSAWNTNDTATNILSGTSMASPHATGAAAVLLSQNPALDFTQVRDALANSAYRNPGVTSSLGACGTSNLSNTGPWPNNVYGYGRIDVAAALTII